MEAEPDTSTLFATDPVGRRPAAVGGIPPTGTTWMIGLRDIDPQERTPAELVQLLGNTAERWATKCLELDGKRVREWWSKWAKSSQADLAPVIASIKAYLPLTLHQLGIRGNDQLQNALIKAERAQRRREQAPRSQFNQAITAERQALARLALLIEEHQHQQFLWERVNTLMERYGYRPDSVLLELAQNADDALAQAAEIEDGRLPSQCRRLVVRVQEGGNEPTVEVLHWGPHDQRNRWRRLPGGPRPSVGPGPLLHDAHESEQQTW